MTDWMDSNHLRKTFLEYFMIEDHEIVPSSSLIPNNDPTLLFTNAGMVQFKETFLGLEKRPYKRATSSQRTTRDDGCWWVADKGQKLSSNRPRSKQEVFLDAPGKRCRCIMNAFISSFD